MLNAMTPPLQPRRVIIDTDPGTDDALAIFLALNSPELKIEALTPVAGNVPLELTLPNALRLLEIAGKTHWGSPARIPAVFGMNFQAVYIGQSVYEPSVGKGGYQNAAALPSAELLNEIEFVDNSIGDIVNALIRNNARLAAAIAVALGP